MIQRLLNRDGCELRARSIAKGSTRSCKPYAFDFFHPAATHALMNGVVLAVDGKKRDVSLARFGGDEFSGGDQTFFVRKAERFARADCFVGRFESGDSDDCADDEVDVGVSCDANGSRGTVYDFDVSKAFSLQL